MSVGSKEGHAEESVEADRNDQHRQNVAIAQFGVKIAKRKPVWEKSRSAPGLRNENQNEPGGFGAER